MEYINKEELYNKTDAGLDIIHLYFPDAKPGVKFRMRPEERTPSADIKKLNKVYHVTDFGGDQICRDPIALCMFMENLPYNQALYKLAGIFKVGNVVTEETAQPRIESVSTSDPDCEPEFELAESFTPEQLKFWLPSMKAETLQSYGWSAVKSYTFVSKGKRIIIHSTDSFPIFVRDCGGFQKLYKPFDFKVRFQYVGKPPVDYVHGLEQLRERRKQYAIAQTPVVEEEKAKFDPDTVKLDECIICSGERDAMTAAMLGYAPIWLNSECATMPGKVIAELHKLCHKIYNVPDLDATGVERGNILAMAYPEIYTVELPSWLGEYNDAKGKKRKDLRDWAELRDGKGLAHDFRSLLISAKCCKFWEKIKTDKGEKDNINTAYLLQFLKTSGFRKMKQDDKSIIYVRITDNIIKEVLQADIRDYIINWVRSRILGNSIENLVLNKANTKGTFADDLDLFEPNLKNYTFKSQLFRFQNCTVEITAEKISTYRKFNGCYFYEGNVIPHRFSYTTPAFESDGTNLTIKHMDSNVFKYLINASRLYWRSELETDNENEDAAYYAANRFRIDGSRLTDKQRSEQVKNLINKLYALGYILYRYKDSSNAMAIWAMENKITNEDQSSGGSGKSIVFQKILAKFLPACTYNGRDGKQTNDTHLLGRVTKNDAFILMNDFKGNSSVFEYFYNAITDNLNKNGKYKQDEEIAFSDSPKLVFTSNFAPPIKMNDSSSFRRLLFMVYSDYYHSKTPENGYKETRQISDDFGGRNLWETEYTSDEYRNDLNFFIDCVQFYLNMRKQRIRCEAPMDNVVKRIRRQSIGDNFIEWADTFFAEGGGHLDCYVPTNDARNAYLTYTGLSNITPQSMRNKLKDWAAQTTYVDAFNPAELQSMDGQIRKNNTTCYYIRSKKKPVDNSPYEVPF